MIARASAATSRREQRAQTDVAIAQCYAMSSEPPRKSLSKQVPSCYKAK